MSGNNEVLIHLFEENPERFFREFRKSIDDCTLTDEDVQRLIEKLERIQPFNNIDYREVCRIFTLNPVLPISKVTFHHLRLLSDKGDLDKILK